jgi:hypothetical protein
MPHARASNVIFSLLGPGMGSAAPGSSARLPRQAKTSGRTTRRAPRAAAASINSVARAMFRARSAPEDIWTAAAR